LGKNEQRKGEWVPEDPGRKKKNKRKVERGGRGGQDPNRKSIFNGGTKEKV